MSFKITFLSKLMILFCLFRSPKICAVEIYFSPGTSCENQIVKAIFESKNEVVASVYSINNSHITEALVAAQKRGLSIKILTDRTQASGKSSLVFDLIKAGVNLRVHSKYKIEHNKFGVFDNKLAINGSYNWTRPAIAFQKKKPAFTNT